MQVRIVWESRRPYSSPAPQSLCSSSRTKSQLFSSPSEKWYSGTKVSAGVQFLLTNTAEKVPLTLSGWIVLLVIFDFSTDQRPFQTALCIQFKIKRISRRKQSSCVCCCHGACGSHNYLCDTWQQWVCHTVNVSSKELSDRRLGWLGCRCTRWE